MGAVLGLDLTASFHPAGDAVRDRDHQKRRGRVVRLIASPPYAITNEAPFPGMDVIRSWDLMLRLDDLLVGIELETRVRDIQACVRRIRAREKHGGVHEIVVVLAGIAHNRSIANELRVALGSRLATDPRQITAALRAGRPVSRSGVTLV